MCIRDRIRIDNLGNLIAFKKGRIHPPKRLMLSAHMDEVGIIITRIAEGGYLNFACVGGIDKRVLPGDVYKRQGLSELDRVLGGGAVIGSIVLVGGAPGVGKSTLLLQITENLKGLSVLYVSGEESERQLKLRADRLGVRLSLIHIYALADGN